MFKELPLKLLALALAIIFWVFVVSLENVFHKFPEPIPVSAFNQADGFALVSELGAVALTLRSDAPESFRTLSAADFEAYVDLGNLGAGQKRVPISVTSKNSKISVVRVAPDFLDIQLEPVKEKILSLSYEISGIPAKGFEVREVVLQPERVVIGGAESLIKKAISAKAVIHLDGTEDKNLAKKPVLRIFDEQGLEIKNVKILDAEKFEAVLSLTQVAAEKQVGVKVNLTDSPAKGFVKKIEVKPSVLTIVGEKSVIETVDFLETEKIDLSNVDSNQELKVKVKIPQGLKLGENQNEIVTVKIEIGEQEGL